MSARPEDTIQRVRDAISRFDSQKSGEPVAPQPEQVVTQEVEAQSPQGTPEPVAFSYDTKYASKAQAEIAMRAAKQAAKRGENVGIHPQAVVKSTGTEFWIGSPTENTKRENAKESTDLIQRIKANATQTVISTTHPKTNSNSRTVKLRTRTCGLMGELTRESGELVLH